MDNNKLEQRYVISKALKASITRLAYFSRNSKSSKANYAFRITNNLDIFDPNPKISLVNKACLNSDKVNSFEVNLIKGDCLKEFEEMSKNIVMYLEKVLCIRISFVVFDFI